MFHELGVVISYRLPVVHKRWETERELVIHLKHKRGWKCASDAKKGPIPELQRWNKGIVLEN